MGGGTGRLPGRDVKRDLAMHVDISYLSHSVYMEIIWQQRFSSRPGKRPVLPASHINSLLEA